MVKNISILFIVTLFIYYGCTSNKNETNSIIEAEFNVDVTLLNPDPVVDSALNMVINIPRNWILMDANLEKGIKSNLHLNSYQNSEFFSGYINTNDSSALIIIDITQVDSTFFINLRNTYDEVFKSGGVWNDVQFQEFYYRCFRVEQYVMQNEHMINFKLIFYEGGNKKMFAPKFEIIYLLNRNFLTANIKSVESSIGSIECLIN